jgi:uncharacterized caspase-like protein
MSKWAFLVGINKYEHFSHLRYAAADAALLKHTLKEFCGFDDDKITLLIDSVSPHHDPASPRHDLTNRAILKKLSQCAQRINPDDTFLFYFAGHGFTSRDQCSYLAGIDAEENENEYVAKAGAISVTDIRDMLNEIPARQRVVICDCCRNTLVKARGLAPNLLTKTMVKDFHQILKPQQLRVLQRGIWGQKPVHGAPTVTSMKALSSAVLLACSPGQQSYESEKLKQGVFTYMLIESLKKPPASKNREVVFGLVVDSIKKRLKDWADHNPAEQMDPYFSEEGGRIVLGVANWGESKRSTRAYLHRDFSAKLQQSIKKQFPFHSHKDKSHS